MARVRTEQELEYHVLKMKEYRRKDRDKFLARERASRARRLLRLGHDGVREMNRKYNLWHKYRITPEQYEAMLAAQDGVCAICGATPKIKVAHGRGQSGRLHVDHDHVTGVLRALLCNHCNQGMIAMDRDPEWANKATAYAAKYRRA